MALTQLETLENISTQSAIDPLFRVYKKMSAAFNRLGQQFESEKYLRKGDRIYVEGRIKTRKWQDEQGNDRYSTEIQCTDFTFLTPKAESGESQAYESQSNAASKPNPVKQQPSMSSMEDDEDDDLPF